MVLESVTSLINDEKKKDKKKKTAFRFSGLTFRSLIHFEFIFVYGVKKCSSFIF